jgi:1-deoxy-D-xylulose-5-phosphate reductoisomerase
MADRIRTVAVLGSTGSIGRNTLEVVAASHGRWQIVALTAHRRLAELCQQAQVVRPRWVVAADATLAAQHDWSGLPAETKLLVGREGLEQVAAHADVDLVVAAIVGSAGLRGTWAGLEAGKTVALANKETLVMAGPLVMQLAERHGARLVPVDSEHSAIFQAMQSGRREEVERIILTASGGPFRKYTAEQLLEVTVAEALEHPTWAMGEKITIDSATMMNKALEIIEARWLFDLKPDQIDVVVHPQSIVHSMVEFRDGSVIAQLSPPDMRLPIQYALSFPERFSGCSPRLDWTAAMQLEFEPPDETRFPALRLGHEVAARGGTAGAVLNAANEAAVAQFLGGTLPYAEIVPACRTVLENHHFDPNPSLDQLLQLDAWAREEVSRWVCTS